MAGFMIVHVGSKNPVKIEAVREAIGNYNIFRTVRIQSVEVQSGVSEQPKSLEEIERGAMNRAMAAFCGAQYGFGIESGIMVMPHTNKIMNIGVCAVYDGKYAGLGWTPAFEVPREISKLILNGGLNASEAARRAGITVHRYIGNEGGVVSILTQGLILRKDLIKPAVHLALIPFINTALY